MSTGFPSSPPAEPTSKIGWLRLGCLGCAGTVGVLGALVLAGAAFYYRGENQRGERAWTDAQHDLRAQDEVLEWSAFVPPPIPAERNLAFAPLFARELDYGPDPATGAYTMRADGFPDLPFGGQKPSHKEVRPASWVVAKPTDLAGYARFFRVRQGFPHPPQPRVPAADVLLALSRYAPTLDEFAQAAAERPATRFPVDWVSDNFQPAEPRHWSLTGRFIQTFSLRASARLAAGQPEEALADLELALRGCRDLQAEPSTYSHASFYLGGLNVVLNTAWEGLAARRWNNAHLVRLQTGLAACDVLSASVAAARGERALTLAGMDRGQKRLASRWSAAALDEPEPTGLRAPGELFLRVMPPGWWSLNKAVAAWYLQDYAIACVDVKGHQVWGAQANKNRRARTMLLARSELLLAQRYLPADLGGTLLHSALDQSGLDMAVAACALERFFLERGTYPATLAELIPTYLPQVPTDVCDGAPLRYRPTSADGRYQLRSVGWNERDDNGQLGWDSEGLPDRRAGDWVWQYTAPSLPPPAALPPESKSPHR